MEDGEKRARAEGVRALDALVANIPTRRVLHVDAN